MAFKETGSNFNPAKESSIFPVLLILAKLQPSTTAEVDDRYKVGYFDNKLT